MSEERAFKGVWLPAEIYLDQELTWMEKFLFVEIDSLDNERGCFASNAYFSKFFGVSEKTISTGIANLTRCGYIKAKAFNGRERVLKVAVNVQADLKETSRQPREKLLGRVEKNFYHILPSETNKDNKEFIIGKNPADSPSKPDKPKVEKKEPDPLETALWESFLAITKTMSDYAIERKTTKTIATRIRNLNPKDPLGAGKAVVSTYHELRQGRDKFWKDQPFTPRGMAPHLDRLWALVSKEQEDEAWMEGLK